VAESEAIRSVRRPEFGYRIVVTEPPYLAMHSVLRVHHLMRSIVDAELKSGFELRIVDYLTLQTLEDSDGGTETLSRIARRLGMHTTTITIAADRLEHRRLVQRRADPDDRRATLVAITENGRALATAATAALCGVEFGLPGLTAAQKRSLTSLLIKVGRG
jgi:DNA-binding MarR family transcriptional regulator